MRFLFVLSTFVSMTGAALAQAPSAPMRIAGVLTAVSPTSLTVKQADGSSVMLGLAKTYIVMRAQPVDIESIKPGSFVASANTDIDASSGKSIELRMFNAGATTTSFSSPMKQAHTTMTNGTVQAVKKGDGGRELDISYPGGVRHIVVPPDVTIIGNFPGSSSDLTVGATVSVIATKDASGNPVGTRITVNGS